MGICSKDWFCKKLLLGNMSQPRQPHSAGEASRGLCQMCVPRSQNNCTCYALVRIQNICIYLAVSQLDYDTQINCLNVSAFHRLLVFCLGLVGFGCWGFFALWMKLQ